MTISRRTVLKGIGFSAAALPWASAPTANAAKATNAAKPGDNMAYGLVTYMWGATWDLPTLIANCEKAQVLGVELRTTHAHGVEPSLNRRQRSDVAKRFSNSRVTLVGLGSNERFDNPDPKVVKKAIEACKAFIVLSHDVGGTGVKVKPDRFHRGVPREKTIEQIGRSLNELGAFAEGYGQQVRLEIHGQCAELPTIKAIMDIADHPSVAVCWNSNAQDLQGKGLVHNYRLVAKRFGATCHVRELESTNYPYQQFLDLLTADDYHGWVMLESSSKPKDPVAALARQARLFAQMKAKSQKQLKND